MRADTTDDHYDDHYAVLGVSPLESYRRDGAAVIREFEASGHHYEAPRVLV